MLFTTCIYEFMVCTNAIKPIIAFQFVIFTCDNNEVMGTLVINTCEIMCFTLDFVHDLTTHITNNKKFCYTWQMGNYCDCFISFIFLFLFIYIYTCKHIGHK